MSDNLYDALEACIEALQRGEDIESCLARYPQLVNQLRPLLAAAADASSLAVEAFPAEVARRGKARFLNAAAELREREARGGVPAGGPAFLARFRRSFLLTFATVTAVLVALLLVGSAGLVSASAAALPGDRLYGVKTSWEDLRLQLASSQAREALQDRYDQERVDEVDTLLQEGRAEDVEFSGTVTALSAHQMVVSGITVFLTDQTQVEGSLSVGAVVKVEGLTQSDGTVVGAKVKVLGSPGGGEDENEGDHSGHGGGSGESSATRTAEPDNSGEGSDDGSGGETPTPQDDSSSGGSTPQAETFDLEGNISQLHNNSITVGGVLIMLDSGTEIRGTLAEGATVRARGVITSNGTYRAMRVEVRSSGGSATTTPTSSSGGGGSGGGSATATATSSSGGGGGDGGGGGGGGGGGDDGGGDGG